MNVKKIALGAAWISALTLSYLAVDRLVALGDWGVSWAYDPRVLIWSLIVTIPPACMVWLCAVLVDEAKGTRRAVWYLIGITLLAWVWLYGGSIALGLYRLQ